jgi:hypothetical protein
MGRIIFLLKEKSVYLYNTMLTRQDILIEILIEITQCDISAWSALSGVPLFGRGTLTEKGHNTALKKIKSLIEVVPVKFKPRSLRRELKWFINTGMRMRLNVIHTSFGASFTPFIDQAGIDHLTWSSWMKLMK